MNGLLRRLLIAGLIGVISACGGGGGGASSSANAPPNLLAVISGDVRSESGEIRMTLGGTARLDASGTTDADQDPLSFEWTLTSKPASSVAVSSGTGPVFSWQPDLLGTYGFTVKASDGKGGTSTRTVTLIADNRPPSASVVLIASAVALNAGHNTLTTSVGYDVLLDGTTSGDPDGDAVTRTWSVTARPAGSTATLSSATGQTALLSPDLMGDYVVTLTITDAKASSSIHTTTVRANNRRPVAQITTNTTPGALPSAPGVVMPLGTQVTLRADASVDADGDAIVYAWSIDARPAGSTAALSSTTGVAPSLTPDSEGSYVLRLRVTDTRGAFSERTVTLQVGTHAPVALVDKTQVTALPGSTVPVSAALSFDVDGDTLSYQWSIDAKPAGSAASLSNAASAAASLLPDVAGVYALAVRVSDGRSTSVAYATVRVLSQFQSSVALSFTPGTAAYSKGLDKLVIASANPDALRLVDPFAGVITSVVLPTGIKSLSLSPDGKLAAVLHEGLVSLVDLQTSTLLRSSSTAGAQTEAFVTDTGVIYAIGQPAGQGATEKVAVINGRTGARITQSGWPQGSATFYGQLYGVFAATLSKAFFVAGGSSPADISYFGFDPSTSQVTGDGDSPYHGHYNINVPLYLSSDESSVFTAVGTYFSTESLRYLGQLNGVTFMHSFSHSSSQQEALALQRTVSTAGAYPASYLRFTGPFLLPDTDLALPQINGAQSYGIKIFHSANGSHVVLVQTGSAQSDAMGVTYHVIVR
jgi:hypothetical protein